MFNSDTMPPHSKERSDTVRYRAVSEKHVQIREWVDLQEELGIANRKLESVPFVDVNLEF